MRATPFLAAVHSTTWRTRTAFWWIFLTALAIAVLAPLQLAPRLRALIPRLHRVLVLAPAKPNLIVAERYLAVRHQARRNPTASCATGARQLAPLETSPRRAGQ
jgi:hypothetical protein